MTSPTLPDNSTAAAVFLRHLLAAPDEARVLVDRILTLDEPNRILALLTVVDRVPAVVADALTCLPCLHGCDHVRHPGETCDAAYIDIDGLEAHCPCSPFPPAEPAVISLTPAILRREEHAADQRADAAAGRL